jgi:hypothetical protein
VARLTGEAKGKLGPFLYLWLALSTLLNISGIASIVDGLVHWVHFFRDFLDIYRTWIREPISWAVHLMWPSWWPRIPKWMFDVFVVWAAFFLAGNICWIRKEGETLVAEIFRQGVVLGVIQSALAPLLCLCASMGYIGTEEAKQNAREIIMYFLLLLTSVVVLAFLNWQLGHIPLSRASLAPVET